jgi:hypothetical protein
MMARAAHSWLAASVMKVGPASKQRRTFCQYFDDLIMDVRIIAGRIVDDPDHVVEVDWLGVPVQQGRTGAKMQRHLGS